MTKTFEIRMGGYGPKTTGFSRALKQIGDRVEEKFGDIVDVKYYWNIMDLGFKGEQIMPLVENGFLTLGYQSSSYLTHRVPELGVLDLPFIFSNREDARSSMDGDLGTAMTAAIEAEYDFRIFGYFENGFRHISNKLRPIRTPADMKDMSIRVLPSKIHEKTFTLLGARALQMDLTEAIAGVVDGSLDAQENPLANTVTYGVHNFHHYHTLMSHFYLSRPIFLHRPSVEAWPLELQKFMEQEVQAAVQVQRGVAITEEKAALKSIEDAGCEMIDLSDEEKSAFVTAVSPLREEAKSLFGQELLDLLP